MIILAGGLAVTPEGVIRADVAIDGRAIARVAPEGIEPASGDEVRDVSGMWVFPGFIDAHTHLQCWTGMDWTADSFETGTRAAACGGTTTVVDYATADRGVMLPDALAEWHRRADGSCTANYAFHMAVTEWNERTRADLAAMRAEGVRSFKTYLAYDHLRLSDSETLEMLEALRELDAILCVHCENGDLVDALQRRMLARGITGPEGHALSRPAEAEADAVSRLLYLAHLAGDAGSTSCTSPARWGSRRCARRARAGSAASSSRPARSTCSSMTRATSRRGRTASRAPSTDESAPAQARRRARPAQRGPLR